MVKVFVMAMMLSLHALTAPPLNPPFDYAQVKPFQGGSDLLP
jgi:hypothetical protein